MNKENVVCIYIYIYSGLLVSHKKEIIYFVAMWMDLEIVILSKSNRTRQISYAITYIQNLKKWYK